MYINLKIRMISLIIIKIERDATVRLLEIKIPTAEVTLVKNKEQKSNYFIERISISHCSLGFHYCEFFWFSPSTHHPHIWISTPTLLLLPRYLCFQILFLSVSISSMDETLDQHHVLLWCNFAFISVMASNLSVAPQY